DGQCREEPSGGRAPLQARLSRRRVDFGGGPPGRQGCRCLVARRPGQAPVSQDRTVPEIAKENSCRNRRRSRAARAFSRSRSRDRLHRFFVIFVSLWCSPQRHKDHKESDQALIESLILRTIKVISSPWGRPRVKESTSSRM